MFINPEALWTPPFWIFVEASLHRQNWLDHHPFVIELDLHPFSSPRRSGRGTESSNPLITSFFLLATGTYPEVLCKSHLINITHLDCSHHLQIPKVLGVLCQKWEKTTYIFCIINHNVTKSLDGNILETFKKFLDHFLSSWFPLISGESITWQEWFSYVQSYSLSEQKVFLPFKIYCLNRR